jgi:hypothetical protein
MSCLMINDLDAGVGRFGNYYTSMVLLIIFMFQPFNQKHGYFVHVSISFIVCKASFKKIEPYIYMVDYY